MFNPHEGTELESILDAYVASVERPTPELLTEWIRKYPQYREELMEFTVAWSHMETMTPTETVAHQADEELLVLRGKSIVQDLLFRKNRNNQTEAPKTPITSLVQTGNKVGLDIQALAERLKLSTSLVAKLERRLIIFISIPRQLLENIAELLSIPLVAVTTYLSSQPTFPFRSSFRADRKPELPSQDDFFDAVRNDMNLAPEFRDYWLELRLREN